MTSARGPIVMACPVTQNDAQTVMDPMSTWARAGTTRRTPSMSSTNPIALRIAPT